MKPNPPRCQAELRDGSGCMAAGQKLYAGRCEAHGIVEVGAELGYRVRGGRRCGVYVA
jgi:hypothetical protein